MQANNFDAAVQMINTSGISNIVTKDATILSHQANLGRTAFLGRTRKNDDDLSQVEFALVVNCRNTNAASYRWVSAHSMTLAVYYVLQMILSVLRTRRIHVTLFAVLISAVP